MDVWDWKKVEKVGSGVAHCAAFYDWSPDSNFLITAVLSPRIRVDNAYLIWSNDCTLIKKEEYTLSELYQVSWNPSSLGISSSFYMPKPKPITAKVEAKAAAKPAVYRHPHFSAGSSAVTLHTKEEAHKFTKGAAVVTKSSAKAKAKAKAEYLPPGADPVVKKTKKKKKKEGAVVQEQEQEASETQTPDAHPFESLSEEEKAKKVKALQKKLRQIYQLKEQQAEGKILDNAQLIKVAAEEEIIKEIEALGGSSTE